MLRRTDSVLSNGAFVRGLVSSISNFFRGRKRDEDESPVSGILTCNKDVKDSCQSRAVADQVLPFKDKAFWALNSYGKLHMLSHDNLRKSTDLGEHLFILDREEDKANPAPNIVEQVLLQFKDCASNRGLPNTKIRKDISATLSRYASNTYSWYKDIEHLHPAMWAKTGHVEKIQRVELSM